ncbi:MAG: NAD-dependent epimerase/dehydratase family protein [Bacteroidia bacterium]|nr:NAD-dependent epimerase/dehydratase family protein [Bacteroidia bacterium]
MIFVTGGTGLVGSHLLYRLIISGETVSALKRPYGDLSFVRKVFDLHHEGDSRLVDNIQWIEGNILDYFLLLETTRNTDQIYHTAAQVSFHPADRSNMLKTNITGTSNIINAALENNVGKFCHVSSIAAFGKPEEDGPVDEETTRIPGYDYSAYSISKYNSELEVWRGIHEGLNAVIINPSVILGYQPWDKGSSRIFSTVDKGLMFYTKGMTGFVDVKDVVDIMIKLMNSPVQGNRFCISSENLSYRQLLDMIAFYLNRKSPRYCVPEYILKWTANIDKVISVVIRNKSIISPESVRSAGNISTYSNKKIQDLLKWDFIPLQQTISELAGLYRKDLPNLDEPEPNKKSQISKYK